MKTLNEALHTVVSIIEVPKDQPRDAVRDRLTAAHSYQQERAARAESIVSEITNHPLLRKLLPDIADQHLCEETVLCDCIVDYGFICLTLGVQLGMEMEKQDIQIADQPESPEPPPL